MRRKLGRSWHAGWRPTRMLPLGGDPPGGGVQSGLQIPRYTNKQQVTDRRTCARGGGRASRRGVWWEGEKRKRQGRCEGGVAVTTMYIEVALWTLRAGIGHCF